MIELEMADLQKKALGIVLLTALLQWTVSCCCGHVVFFECCHSGDAQVEGDKAQKVGHHCPHSSPGGHDETPCDKQSLSWMLGPDERADETHAPCPEGASTAAADSSSLLETAHWAVVAVGPPIDRTLPQAPFGAVRFSTSRWLN